jgi:hypothetical protein
VAHNEESPFFFDCSAESPKGRRNVRYDREGLEAGKANKPEDTAIDMAAAMGIELLTEEHYRELQNLGNFDTKTSSWVKTPSDIREPGGALFADRRYGRVFVYHTSAPSSYGGRGSVARSGSEPVQETAQSGCKNGGKTGIFAG